MSLTINGATNTLTAASGLAIAGNTAVTGTLSATSSVALAATQKLYLDGVAATGNTYIHENSADSLQLVAGGTAAVTATSTGLGIGLSPSVRLDTLGALGRHARIGGFQFGGTSATADAGNNLLSSGAYWNGTNFTATQTTAATVQFGNGAVNFYADTGLTPSGTFAAVAKATLDSTALTLGTGVNLNIKRAQAILADGTDGYLVYGSSTTSTTGAALVMYGETHVGTPNEAQFRVNNTTKMTVATSAVTLGAGVNLVMASGKGIDFSATANGSGTTTSEVLDDYEAGTWTPSVGGDATYTTQLGQYTKIGRQVTAKLDLTINTIGTGSANAISGLPFANNATLTADFTVSYFTSLAVSPVFLGGFVGGSATSLNLNGLTAAGASVSTLNALGNGARIIATVTYFV
jgi:hypothetical protein